jgi:hypothetical protein
LQSIKRRSSQLIHGDNLTIKHRLFWECRQGIGNLWKLGVEIFVVAAYDRKNERLSVGLARTGRSI